MSHTPEGTSPKKAAPKAGAGGTEHAKEQPKQTAAQEKIDKAHMLKHIKHGAADMLVKHLNGWVMGAATFLEEREKAVAEDKRGGHHTLKHLNAAYRKYRTHTHHAKADFVDHVLQYKDKHPKKK
jgi:hypothetical protein